MMVALLHTIWVAGIKGVTAVYRAYDSVIAFVGRIIGGATGNDNRAQADTGRAWMKLAASTDTATNYTRVPAMTVTGLGTVNRRRNNGV